LIQRLSPLGKTWILDLDGTVVKHNGYKTDGFDTLLPGARDFLQRIPQTDMIVFITSRTYVEQDRTEAFLNENGIRFTCILYNAPFGERILINDRKPSGLNTAIAVNTDRDVFCRVEFETDPTL
jgi:hypothetical protein